MNKKDKALVAEALNRICACVGAIAGLFDEASESRGRDRPDPVRTPDPLPAEEPPDAAGNEPAPGAGEPCTLEQAREVLAEKARAGCRAEVKALLAKHGVRQLSEVTDPEEFREIINEAEAFGNG